MKSQELDLELLPNPGQSTTQTNTEIQQSNPKLKLGGVLIKHRSNALRKWLPEQIRGRLDTIRNGIRFQNEIRVDQELAKMAVKHSPACVYSSKSAGVEDYYVVTQEFIKRTKS